MKSNTHQIKNNIIAVTFVIVISTFIFLFIGNKKRISYCDEVYTYTITNAISAFVQFDPGVWTSGDEVLESFVNNDKDSISRLLVSVKYDKVHPPIYYILLFGLFKIFKGSISLWIPLSLNLIFYLGTIFIVYLFLDKIFKNVKVSIVGSIIFAGNIGILSSAMFIRMYMMLIFLVMLFVYINFLIWENRDKYYLYFILFATTVIGFLTQYYFALFAIGSFIIEFLYDLIKKKYKSLGIYLFSMAISVVASTILWKTWYDSLVGNVHSEAMKDKTKGIFSTLIPNLVKSVEYLYGTVFRSKYGIIFFVLLLLIIFILFSNKIKEKYSSNIIFTVLKLFVAANFNAIVITEMAPDYLLSTRYYYAPASQILLIFIICAIMVFDVLFNKIGIIVTLIILFTFNGYISIDNKIDYYVNYKDYDQHTEILNNYADIPWIISGGEGWLVRSNLMDFVIPKNLIMIDENCTVKNEPILSNTDSILLFGYDEYSTFSDIGLQYFIDCTGYEVKKEKLMVWNALSVYLVTKIK